MYIFRYINVTLSLDLILSCIVSSYLHLTSAYFNIQLKKFSGLKQYVKNIQSELFFWKNRVYIRN